MEVVTDICIWEYLFPCTLVNTVYNQTFWIFASMIGEKWYLSVVLINVSLKSEAELLFIWLRALSIIFFPCELSDFNLYPFFSVHLGILKFLFISSPIGWFTKCKHDLLVCLNLPSDRSLLTPSLPSRLSLTQLTEWYF